MKKKIVIIGSGGHAISLIDLIKSTSRYEIIGYFDILENKNFNVKYLGSDSNAKNFLKIKNAALGIGLNVTQAKKISIVQKYKKLGFVFPPLKHKFSYISETVKICEGSQIFAGCIINSNSIIGNFSTINTASLIEHDCIIGQNCFIAPKSVLLGGCEIGKNSIIGSNNLLLPKTKLKAGSFIKSRIK